MRARAALAAALLVVEAAMWSVVAPLLPLYAHAFGLSQAAAGLIAAGYTAGVALSASAALVVPLSWGPRAQIVTGLVVLTAATVLFAAAPSVGVLIAARVAQGIGGGQVWVGAYSWLISAGTPERSARYVGLGVGASALGTVAGPVVGTLAVATGPTVTLLALAAVVAAALPCVLVGRSDPPSPRGRLAFAALRSRDPSHSLWPVALLSLPVGLSVAVAPLRLHALGFSPVGVGAIWLAASALGSVVSVGAGHRTAPRNRWTLITAGMIGTAACLLLVGLATSPTLVAVALVAMVGVTYAAAMPGAGALVADRPSLAGSAMAAPAVTLITITGAESVGSAGGTELARLSPAAPFGLLAAVILATTVPLWRRQASV